ncbi:TPA: hypothetical protein PXJ49_001556 [Yersinia enterocolitica]|nr:hypothetical protein [Yersinia enterocolitica]
MTLKQKLNRLMKVIIDEAEHNPAFNEELIKVIGNDLSEVNNGVPKREKNKKRTGNRRTPAVFDPIQIVREEKLNLTQELEKLTLEQLKDIVAEYGMDPSRVVMRWSKPQRIIDKIVEMSLARSRKGDAFRRPVENSISSPIISTGVEVDTDRSSESKKDEKPDA